MPVDEKTIAPAWKLRSLVWPGGFTARNIHEFWENLKNGIESISFFTDDELKESGVEVELLHNSNSVRAHGILEDIEYFDSSFFYYTPKEAEIMDPLLRIFHECV